MKRLLLVLVICFFLVTPVVADGSSTNSNVDNNISEELSLSDVQAKAETQGIRNIANICNGIVEHIADTIEAEEKIYEDTHQNVVHGTADPQNTSVNNTTTTDTTGKNIVKTFGIICTSEAALTSYAYYNALVRSEAFVAQKLIECSKLAIYAHTPNDITRTAAQLAQWKSELMIPGVELTSTFAAGCGCVLVGTILIGTITYVVYSVATLPPEKFEGLEQTYNWYDYP